MEFEWDENKNLKNKEKHKIDFEKAKTIFDDPNAIELEASRNGEYRIIRIGKTATNIYTFGCLYNKRLDSAINFSETSQ